MAVFACLRSTFCAGLVKEVAPKTAYLALLTKGAWERQETRSRSGLNILPLANSGSTASQIGFIPSAPLLGVTPPFFGIQLQFVSLMFPFNSFHNAHGNC